jgi:small-conductance mechanosensitive channel
MPPIAFTPLQITDTIEQTIADVIAYLPTLLSALVILVVGYIVGRILGGIVTRIVRKIGIESYARGTAVEEVDSGDGVARALGKLVTYYIYLLTLLAVADILAIDALSQLLNTFAGSLPALVGGLLVLLVGIWVAERLADIVDDMGDGRPTHVASLVVKVFVYYITVTIALGTIGFNTAPLTSLFTAFVVAFLGVFALALAIGIGVAIGLGGQDYVAEDVDDWAASLRATAEDDSTTGD